MAEKKKEEVSNPNMTLWDSVFKTDPGNTKAFNKGYKGTAIKPISLIHKATEQWGPMGDRWGAEEAEREVIGNLVFIKVRVWYPGVTTNRAVVEHWGGDVIMRADGKPNDEAFKMAFTDAIGKCLVQLGFSADVHMGKFDDSKYVQELAEEFSNEPKEPSKPVFDTLQARNDWCLKVKDEFAKAKTVEALDAVRALYKTRTDQMKESGDHLDKVAFEELKNAYMVGKAKILLPPTPSQSAKLSPNEAPK